MRIAQVAPLWERVPPIGYGGIELVVGLLTDELVRRGHEVTLFASGDSESLAKLESVYPRPIRTDSTVKDYNAYLTLQLPEIYRRANEFDIINSHVDYPALPYASFVKTPTVHTLHGQFTSENKLLFSQCKKQNYVSIYNSQREPLPDMNYVGTVSNGIDVNNYKFHPQPNEEPYLAFLGRVSPEKGPHLAIEIAKRTGWKLKMACKVDAVDREFFETKVMPHVDGEQIKLMGEITPEEKHDSALTAVGLRSMGKIEQAFAIAEGLIDMTKLQPNYRPPELFCGFPREANRIPVKYPVACFPQAWATGAIFQILQMMVNLIPDAANKCLAIENPALPKFINHLSVQNLKVGNNLVDLNLEKIGDTITCKVVKQQGDLRVLIET